MKSALRLFITFCVISLTAFLANCGGGFQPSQIQGGSEAGNPPTDGQFIGGTEAGNPPDGDHGTGGTTGSVDPREGQICGEDGKTPDGQDCDPTITKSMTDQLEEQKALQNAAKNGPLPLHPSDGTETTDQTPTLDSVHRSFVLDPALMNPTNPGSPQIQPHPLDPAIMKIIPLK